MQHQKWASLSAALTIATAVHAQVVLYVDDDAPAGGDGLSWSSAFNDLQDALDSTRTVAADVSIVLAQGIYLPDRGSGSRDASFELGADDDFQTNSTFSLRILGGFAGLGATDPDDRDPVAFVSVLSGDLQADDTEDFGTRLDNSYHVVTLTQGTGRLISCIGVTIRGGYADGAGERANGGGFYFDTQDSLGISMNECNVEDCHATGQGGGLYSDMPGLGLYGLTIRSCSARNGGGIAVGPGDSLGLDHGCAIIDCLAENGGAIYLPTGGVHGSIREARFLNNSATHGGAIFSAMDVTCSGALFAGNTASIGGAVDLQSTAADLSSFRSSTFVNNRSSLGGAIAMREDTPVELVGCILWGNDATEAGDAVWMRPGSELRALDSCVESGQSAVLNESGTLIWGRGMISADPLFLDPVGPDLDPDTAEDNDYQIGAGSPCIDAAPRIGFRYIFALNHTTPVNATCSATRTADMGCYEYLDVSCEAPDVRVYVDASAPPGGDGLSWATALRTIQDALRVPGAAEVWVAAGVYLPPPPSYGLSITIASPNPDFRLLGGFAGWEASVDQRDPAANHTIISSDQSANDDPDLPSDLQNNGYAIRVYSGNACIDGFIIEEAGIIGSDASLALANCTLRNIHDFKPVIDFYGDVTITNTAFAENSGRIAISDGFTRMQDCVFAHNTAFWGASVISLYGDAMLDRCRFIGNEAGACIYSSHRSELVLTNSVFIGNEAPEAHLVAGYTTGLIANCAFARNTATSIARSYEGDSGAEVVNCWLWQNAIENEFPFNHDASHCLADNVLVGAGNVLAVEPGVVRLPSAGADEQWGTSDDDLGDLRPRAFSPLIDAGDSYALPDAASIFDLAGELRLVDDPSVADTGLGFPAVDIGPYERQDPSCLADWTEDGLVDINDAMAYLADFAAEDPRADLINDGRLNFFDVQAFLQAFADGCP